jgi:hypothetical protein
MEKTSTFCFSIDEQTVCFPVGKQDADALRNLIASAMILGFIAAVGLAVASR